VDEAARGGRSGGPDQVKALLLTLVIFGHTIPEGVSGSLTKWLIYGVHMPAFLFISGYLITRERLLDRSYPQFFLHYLRRMLLPWLVVALAWGLSFGTFNLHRPVHSLVYLVVTPQWHLWYVPVLFAMLTLAWTAVRIPATTAILGGLAALGVLVWGTPLAAQLVPGADGLGDHRYFGYLIWFVLGLAMRNGALRLPSPAVRWGLATVGAVSYLAGFWLSPWVAALGFIALNAGLLLGLPSLLERLRRPLPGVGGYLSFVGRHSLWIYLLHPFVTMPVHNLNWPSTMERPLGVLVTAAILAALAVVYLSARRSELRGRPSDSVQIPTERIPTERIPTERIPAERFPDGEVALG
jgi:fucose 4-O-acetylase-like acetyltransferase